MIEVSSFLSGKNLCNIFADLIVKEIDKLSPDAKTQIKVINVRSFFIVKGFTTSKNVINVSDILTELYQQYDENLIKTVRVIDTIIYDKPFDTKLNLVVNECKKSKNIEKDLRGICNRLQKKGLYLNLKIYENNLLYDFERPSEFDHDYISSNFTGYDCIKDDFSNDVYYSDLMYGMSDNYEKYYHFLLNKISHNLLNRGFSESLNVSVFSEKELEDVDSENVYFSILNKTTVNKEKLESLVLDNFSFKLSDLQNEFNLSEFDVVSNLTEAMYEPIWENYNNTRDLMFL